MKVRLILAAMAALTLVPTVASATTTVTFDSPAGSTGSLNSIQYQEAGFTFRSVYGNGNSGHLHSGVGAGGTLGMLNHSGCCSTPYRITYSGGSFTASSLTVTGGGGASNTLQVMAGANPGATFNIPTAGTYSLPSTFENATEIQWFNNGISTTIDNFVFNLASPDLGVSPSSLGFGNVRLGTTSDPMAITVTNTGDPGTTLTGAAGAATGTGFGGAGGALGGGAGLAAGASDSFSYTYTPNDRTADSGNVAITSNAGNQDVSLSGNGVGPQYESTPGTPAANDAGTNVMITFDSVDTVVDPSETTATLEITNNTPDGDLGELTDLSLLAAFITGTNGDQFEIDFTPTVLGAGDSETFELTFSVNPFEINGLKTALLEIQTDQNAAFGQTGDSFFYQLKGVQTPEPLSLALWGMIGMAGYGYARRRRSQDSLAA